MLYFSHGYFLCFVLIDAHLRWVRVSGFGVCDRGFPWMGFGACGVGLSGVFGVGALYINIEE